MTIKERKEILYEIVIGKPLIISKNMFTPLKNESDKAIQLEDYYDKNDANAYLFNEHQITFKIKMSSKTADANKATIKMYNLDDEVLEYLVTNQENKLVFTLSCGDNVQGLGEIFNGTIEKVENNETNETRITTLIVMDGVTQIKNAKSVRRWPRGTPLESIIRDLSNDMKVPVNRLSAIEGKIESPQTFMGSTYNMIREKLESLGYDYSIDKGKATIIPKNKRFKKEVSYISEESGLIGKVNKYTNSVNSTATNSSSDSQGISFVCLLDNTLAPNETIYVKSGEFDGAYKIIDVTFSGNYEGNDWTCSVIAIETSGEIVDV